MIYEYFNFSLFQFGLSLWNDLWIFFIFFSLFQFGCCGVGDGGYLDWSLNMYFNCSMGNPSVERCGVPFSCCINQNNVDVSGNTGINSLAPGNLNEILDIIFKQILVIDGCRISCEIALIWLSLDFTDDQKTLVQVMAWCRQATSHYLSQCWPRSLSQ